MNGDPTTHGALSNTLTVVSGLLVAAAWKFGVDGFASWVVWLTGALSIAAMVLSITTSRCIRASFRRTKPAPTKGAFDAHREDQP